MQNSQWSLSGSDPNYYVLTTNQVIGEGDSLSVGLTGQFTANGTSGSITVSSVLTGGGDGRSGNNLDADNVEYFQR